MRELLMKLSDELAFSVGEAIDEATMSQWADCAAELEKELADCKRAWELHDCDFSELKEMLPHNSHYYLRLAREDAAVATEERTGLR